MGISPQTMILLLVLGVILFGKRLPEMAKQIGKSVLEFKRGMDTSGDGLDVRLTSKRTESEDVEKRESTDSRFEPPA